MRDFLKTHPWGIRAQVRGARQKEGNIRMEMWVNVLGEMETVADVSDSSMPRRQSSHDSASFHDRHGVFDEGQITGLTTKKYEKRGKGRFNMPGGSAPLLDRNERRGDAP